MRYKVTASRLNVREGPDTSYSYLGYVHLNEIVDEIETNADKSWIKIRRADGLIGWSSARYLDKIVDTQPDDGTGIKYRCV